MSHSLIKVWIHGVFSTKDFFPIIETSFEKQLHNHIKEEVEKTGSFVRIINGMAEHIHILFMLNPNISIADLFKQIKGESSHWINLSEFIKSKFAWQTGYGAFSVSESMVDTVERYIANQKEHHKRETFMEEYDRLIAVYGYNIQSLKR